MFNNRRRIELLVGVFIVIGVACISYIAINLGDISMFGRDQYELKARFTSSSGLRKGAYVEAAGVRIGIVRDITFIPDEYLAEVTMAIDNHVEVQEDASASISTAGIIGDKFIKITPGGLDDILEPGEEILETEPSINLEELISKYVFESGDK